MLMRVDPANPVPVYAQIVAQVKQAVASGVVRPGESLPSLRDCARQLRVNPNTVVKAYRELEADGVVRTEHGRGTFVVATGPAVSDAARAERLRDLAEQYTVDAYHLGASEDEALDAVRDRLSAMHPAFAARDVRAESFPNIEPEDAISQEKSHA